MLEYGRIDISEGIDINKTNTLKECDICYYWYFKDSGFKYEPHLCNDCHDFMQKEIVSVKRSDHRIHFWYMSKDDVINIMNNFDISQKLCIIIFF